ncbi:MAG: glycoside hydrolase family 2 TIM barrel-domain containing protein [Silvibacterium sp.]
MIVQSRRAFVASLLASGAGFAGTAHATRGKESAHNDVAQNAPGSFALEEGWLFAFDANASMDPSSKTITASDWMHVTVPHTWQAMAGDPGYVGVAWYKLEFTAPSEWTEQFVRIEFEAITHTAHVFLNGKAAGQHVGKGYTAFTCDLSPLLDFGAANVLMVRVDNRPSNTMLPRNKSYDWADDGGLIRPVNLLVTPRVFVERVEIDATPDLVRKEAHVSIRAHVRNTSDKEQAIELYGSLLLEGSAAGGQDLAPAQQKLAAGSTTVVELPPILIASPALWHFDTPHLYQATFPLRSEAGEYLHHETFGIRSFEVRGTAFYLNGERVSLIGVERMAGSNPDFGMAETTEWIRSNHRDMKELNCVFTRVHWAQDKRVLDFCDRNGILMQEEVPAWGGETFYDTTDELQHALEQNGLEQLREMIARDRNHPCIVSWGLCNEVNGKNPRSRQFAHVIADEARELDPSRLLTYASNSLDSDPGADMAGDFDFISANEYYGSWAPGGPPQVQAYLQRIREAFPSKPIVISEYGWCECQPIIMPGDDNRVDIVNEHTEVFREFPDVAGAIYFDYNDYRTLVGDKGTGAMRQRVHGVVDLYAQRKHSFSTLRTQCSPIEKLSILNSTDGSYRLVIAVRKQLPGYPLRGYQARWIVYGYDDLPMHGVLNLLPEMQPGESHTVKSSFPLKDARRIVVDILRPTGFSAASAELLLQEMPAG